MMEDTFIAIAVSIILSTVKNPASKAKVKKAMLKIFRTIRTVYAGDPDFE